MTQSGMNNVLTSFNSIVDHMSMHINNVFLRIMEECKDLNPKYEYYLKLRNKDNTWEKLFCLEHYEGKWYVEFSYEDHCCHNELPCEDYRDSIIGMTTSEVAQFFSVHEFIVHNKTLNWFDEITGII